MTIPENRRRLLDDYVRYFEALTPETIDELDRLAAEDMIFEDPFNRLTRRSDVKRLFREMFEDTKNPAFKISDIFWSPDATKAILKWRFTGSARVIGAFDFDGLSEICFDETDRVCSHIDYWEAATHFYGRIPVIGTLIRLVRNRLRLS